MSDDEDLELQALQRTLDDAFKTTRPRAGFEDELWSTVRARRPIWSRVRDFLAGLVGSVQEAPAVPAAAVAVVLIVAIGVTIVSLGGSHFGGGAASSQSTKEQPGSAQFAGTPGAFGRLPAPALRPEPASDAALPTTTNPGQTAAQSGVVTYFGPAHLVWSGQFNLQVTTALVYRYVEPSNGAAGQFAASLGATRQPGTGTPGVLGSYSGNGFILSVIGTSPSPLREPFFFLTPDRSTLPSPAPTPDGTASNFLSAHSLFPTWPHIIAVENSADVVRVLYLRQFAAAGGPANLVNALGDPYGLEVDLRANQPLQAFGPMPLNLDSSEYSIVSADQAVRLALSSSPAAATSIEPIPMVQLTDVQLVYALAVAGDHSFYEPAFLFSGTFTHNGVTYTKRVLVPAVDPSQISG
jgi:hypothetical protein